MKKMAGFCFIEPDNAIEAMESLLYSDSDPEIGYAAGATAEEAEEVAEDYIAFLSCAN